MSKKHGQQVGIEAKIEYIPALDVIGAAYESWRRTALNWLQSGLTEDQVEKRLQADFNLQWAWADSIATESKQTLDQLIAARGSQIVLLTERIKAKTKKATRTLKDLQKRLTKPFKTQQQYDQFQLELMGLKSKVAKISSLKADLASLKQSDRLHICFGSSRLFNAQYHLKANGYDSHEQWLEDWHKKRSGRFLCIGKGQLGGGTMIKVFPVDDDGNYLRAYSGSQTTTARLQ